MTEDRSAYVLKILAELDLLEVESRPDLEKFYPTPENEEELFLEKVKQLFKGKNNANNHL